MIDATSPGGRHFDPAFDFAPFIAFQDERAWAVQKALLFPHIDVFYSLIPKNACTSLLTALAVANGLTSSWFQSRNRIHNIQQRFSAFQDLDRFNDDSFRLIAIRDPFRRAISALGNKLVGTTAENQLVRSCAAIIPPVRLPGGFPAFSGRNQSNSLAQARLARFFQWPR